MSENNTKERKEKKHNRSTKKIIITESQIAGWLEKPADCLDWINSQPVPPIRRLEVLQTILQEMSTNYDNWMQHYKSARVGRFIGQLMSYYKDTLHELPTGYARETYQFTFSFIGHADNILKKLPYNNKKPISDTSGDSIAWILDYLNDILNSENFSDPSSANPDALLSLLYGLKKHRLISQAGVSWSISLMGTLAASDYFQPVKLGKIDQFFKNQELTAENAGHYLDGMANLAKKNLLKGPIPAESFNFLLEIIFSSNNPQGIRTALGNLRTLITKKCIKNTDNLNLACVDRYFLSLRKKPERKVKSFASRIDLYILSASLNDLSHICRDLKKIGSYRSDISMSSLEIILENVISDPQADQKLISDTLIDLGHIVQAQGLKSSEKLKTSVMTLLNKINHKGAARKLRFNGIANVLYGSFLLQVLAPSSTDKLVAFFNGTLERLFKKSRQNLEKFQSYVSQVAQYVRHCGDTISKEMEYLIKQRRPLTKKKSFEYKLIQYVKNQAWFKDQRMNDQFESDIYFVDGKVDLPGEDTFYIVEIDGDIFHDPVKDKRRDAHLLKLYKEQYIETMGIIRIRVKKNTTLEDAARDWRRQYQERSAAYKKSKLTASKDDDDLPEEVQEEKHFSSEAEDLASPSHSFRSEEDTPEEVKDKIYTSSEPEDIESPSHSLGSSDGSPKEMKDNGYSFGEQEDTESPSHSVQEDLSGLDISPHCREEESAENLCHLASCYEQGFDVDININEAISLYSLAADKGSLEAQQKLATYYEEGIYVKHNLERAYGYHLQAANQNYPEAILSLAFYRLNGIYVEQNIALGEKLLVRALSSNNYVVRKEFENSVKEFLAYMESELIKSVGEITPTGSLSQKDSPDHLILRLSHLMQTLTNTHIKRLNSPAAYSITQIFHREMVKERSKRLVQASTLIKTGQRTGAPWMSERPDKEKTVGKDLSARKPLGDITNVKPLIYG